MNQHSKAAQSRVIESKPCSHCGANITGLKIKKYCNNACRQKAKRKRGKVC